MLHLLCSVSSLLYAGDQGHSISPITPSELLIALHNIDCTNDDALMKAVVKGTYFRYESTKLVQHVTC